MSSSMNMYNFAVNHDEAATLVRANGSNITYIIEGEPGSSKSSILKTIEAIEGDKYEYIYIDAPLKDIPDIALTMPHHESQTTRAYINQIWMGKDANKPKIVMIDEVFKCTPYVQLMLNRLMLDHYVGDYQLPAGSIVFGTTNFAADGVGDKTNGHTNSRVARIPMRKPNQVEWTKWAVNNNINPFILTWIVKIPRYLVATKTRRQHHSMQNYTLMGRVYSSTSITLNTMHKRMFALVHWSWHRTS